MSELREGNAQLQGKLRSLQEELQQSKNAYARLQEQHQAALKKEEVSQTELKTLREQQVRLNGQINRLKEEAALSEEEHRRMQKLLKNTAHPPRSRKRSLRSWLPRQPLAQPSQQAKRRNRRFGTPSAGGGRAERYAGSGHEIAP
ncbi:hypothetical protein VQ056_01545 [Paenibacillus sp. JTLBN-2024]